MIDYSIIDSSVRFYEKVGYQRIESPWTVTKGVSAITKPVDKLDFELKHDDDKVLVASGEQSFLYLYLKGFLPKGRFQTVTPCFRRESFDSLHSKYFIKNELIITDKVDKENLEWIIRDAYQFFRLYFAADNLRITADAFGNKDICYYSPSIFIELGSYGIRKCDFLTWIYGTGVAEPRLSSTITKHNIK